MATVNGDSGDETINGGTGDDSLSGNGGSDTIRGGAGQDTLRGGTGNDSLDGGEGHDDVYGGSGNDSISGGDGEDWIWGEDGNDTISGDAGNDSVFGGDGNDSIDGGSGSDTLRGEAGNDSIEGGDGSDLIYGGDDADTIDGGADEDFLSGDGGDDSVSGGSGNDTVVGELGDDTLHGDDGDDIISGHSGDDALYGDAGNDSLYGGSGDDYFDGGAGDDQFNMSRNAGNSSNTNNASESDNDVVRLHSGSGHDVAYDFQGEDDYIYIGSIPESDIIFTQTGPSTWVLTQSGGSANDSLTINFAPGTEPDSEDVLRKQLLTDSEYTPPENGNNGTFTPACFTAKSRILTPHGLRAIGKIKRGDLVMTADRGPQPVLGVLKTRFEHDDLVKFKSLRPVVIEAGAFGTGRPKSRMHVSRQHGFAIQDGTALVRAAHLAEHFGLARIQDNRPNAVSYVHLLMKDHNLVHVEGVWTESFYSAPNGGTTDVLASSPDIVHASRCRPLLTRAYLRNTSPDPRDIGHLADQSAPSILADVATASAPLWVSP